MFKKIIPLSLLVLFMGFFLYHRVTSTILPIESSGIKTPYLTIDGRVINLEIADTEEKRRQGLSDRTELCPECGMLFIFPESQVQRFWMKNMHFPLDIIWIAGDEIVNISKNLQPEGENPIKTFSSLLPVDYVLEVNAGLADKYNLINGNHVAYKFD